MWKPLAVIALVAAAACSTGVETPVKTVQDLGIENAVVVDERLVSSGQPTAEQLAQLEELGFEHIIQLRPSTEEGTGWEEERARELGLGFQRLPIRGGEDITEANAMALHQALEEAGDGRVLISCSSGNRVGGLLALRAHFALGATPEEALAIGRRAGVTRAEPAVRKALGLPAVD